MKKSREQLVSEIQADEELRPFFIDYLGENLKMTYGRSLGLNLSDKRKFTECADSKLAALTRKLEARVPRKYIDFVLNEVCRYYAHMSIVTSGDRIERLALPFEI